jgi:sec-independent protein translocase protein TatC
VSSTKRRRPSNFQRAAEGSMTLMEHISELRNRLFRACLAIVAGAIGGFFIAKPVLKFLNRPYCDFMLAQNPASTVCNFNVNGIADAFMLQLKLALYLGLLASSPIWLYQLWAFIAPGLHRRERRYTYAFVAVAVPLFAGGVVLGHFVIEKSLQFFLKITPEYALTANLTGYFDFVTGVMLLFGAAFEFPLIVLMLNFAGVLSAKRMFGWWRIAIFLMFLFAAIVTPTPDPFGMTALASCMAVLYFGAVGIAFINDRRRGRRSPYAGLKDDEASPIEPVSPVDAPTWGAAPDYDERR